MKIHKFTIIHPKKKTQENLRMIHRMQKSVNHDYSITWADAMHINVSFWNGIIMICNRSRSMYW